MATEILIKRSGVSVAPTQLKVGELAYSWEASTGGKLYFGAGAADANGFVLSVSTIGGQYFVDKLDHTPGVLTANSALLVDASSKLDQLLVDNIRIDDNSIYAANGEVTDLNLNLTPQGAGSVHVSNSKITGLLTPTADTDAATKLYVDTLVSNTNNTFVEGEGIDLALVGTQLTISAEYATTTNPGIASFDSTDFAINATGGVTVNAITLGSTAINPGATTTEVTGLTSLTTADLIATGNTDLGDAITDTLTVTARVDSNIVPLTDNTYSLGIDGNGWSDIYTQDMHVAGTLFSDDITAANITIAGNLTVEGTTTTVNTETINLADNIINLNSNLDGVTAPVQDAGIEINRGSSAAVSLLWDETLDQWTVGSETFVAATFIGALSGNATTATTLQTARTINGTSFNGSADITVTAAAGTLTGTTLNSTVVSSSLTSVGTITSGTWSGSFGAVSGANLTSLTAANISSGDLGVGVLPYATASATSSAFKVPFLNTTTDVSGNYGLLHDTAGLTYNPATNTLTATNFAGNATTASAWETGRTITLTGDVTGVSASWTGSGNISFETTIAANSVALGADTAGDYVATVGVTAETGLSVSGTGEGAAVTIAGVNATTTVKGVASFAAANFDVTAGAVSITAIDGGVY